MLGRLLVATVIAGMTLAGCSAGQSASEAPLDAGTVERESVDQESDDNGTVAIDDPRVAIVAISTDSGLGISFDVISCDSDDRTAVNLQGTSQSGDVLDLRAQVVGTLAIVGSSAAIGEVTSVAVSDGTIEAVGMVTFADDPAPTAFTLSGDCP